MTSRVVVVTGSATGIGEAAAHAFAALGDTVYLVDIDQTGGTRVASEVGDSARFLRCDLVDEGEVRATVAEIEAEAGAIDVLVNNAGGFGEAKGIEDLDLDEWRRLLDVNLTSMFLMTQAALPLLRRGTGRRIINLGSLAGQTAGWKTSPAYVAAKGGVHALTRAMATELAPDRITVNALAPSAVLTDRIRRLRDEEALAATAATIPLGRYQEPAETAAWIVFLASEEAGFMTGQTVSVNGGRLMT